MRGCSQAVRRNPAAPQANWRNHLRAVPSPCDLTLADLAARWLEREQLSGVRRGMRDARSAVTRHVGEALGELTAREITQEIVVAWMAGQLATGYAEATVKRHLSYLASVLDMAIAVGAAENNVARGLPRGHVPSGQPREPGKAALEVLSASEVESLLSASPVQRRVLWAVLLYTGARFGEAAALRWGDLTDRTPLAQVTIGWSWDCRDNLVKPTKTGLTRYVPVHPRLAQELVAARAWFRAQFRREPGGEDLVCPGVAIGRGVTRPLPWHESTALKWWRKDLARSGVGECAAGPRRLHSTRHTFCSALVNAGVPDRVWKALTHVVPVKDAADRYAHPNWQTLCQAVLQIGGGQ